MTKLTIKATTPSEAIVKQAALSEVIQAGGKTINIQKPGVLAQFRIVEIVGAKTAMNAVYMDMLMPVQWVTHIDGAEIPQPQTRLELDALIQRLGEEAIVAIGRRLAEMAVDAESSDTVKK